MKKIILLSLILSLLILSSCISKKLYKEKEQENLKLSQENSELNSQLNNSEDLSKEKDTTIKNQIQTIENLKDQLAELELQIATEYTEEEKLRLQITLDSLQNEVIKSQLKAEYENLVPQEPENLGIPSVMKFSDSTSSLAHMIERLIGTGVTLLPETVKSNLSPKVKAYGIFEDSTRSFGIGAGFLMTTGSILNAVGPNLKSSASATLGTSGDSELTKLFSEHQTYDACIIEFDVIPHADTLAFNFVFASEEYGEWVGSKYDDVFAFNIKGKGINGSKNMAMVPNTNNYVSINNVNGGNQLKSYSPMNSTFFVDNNNNQNPNLAYDGYTRVFKIRQRVIPNETYHLKLSIADVSDRIYDSGLFIQGKSIISYDKQYKVYFPTDKYYLTNQAKLILDELIQDSKKMTESIFLEIAGHTDNQGTSEYNLKLSKRRNQSVINYLKKAGIKEENFDYISWGEKMPWADNETDNGRSLNRRVEVRVLGRQKEE